MGLFLPGSLLYPAPGIIQAGGKVALLFVMLGQAAQVTAKLPLELLLFALQPFFKGEAVGDGEIGEETAVIQPDQVSQPVNICSFSGGEFYGVYPGIAGGVKLDALPGDEQIRRISFPIVDRPAQDGEGVAQVAAGCPFGPFRPE